jgi:hypothetical protein
MEEFKSNFPPWTSNDPIVRSYYVVEDMNRKGLRRAKKKTLYFAKTGAGYFLNENEFRLSFFQ